MVDVTSILTDLAIRYGYLGVFATTLLGSAVPFLPFPNLLVVVLLSNILDPPQLGLLAYLGRFFFAFLANFLGEGEVIATILAFLITIATTLLLRKANWKLALEVHRKSGLRGVISSLPYLFDDNKSHEER